MMYRVAVNTAITFFKKEKRWSETFTDASTADAASEEYSGEKDHQLEIFYNAVHQLNPVEKALIFYFMEGLHIKRSDII